MQIEIEETKRVIMDLQTRLDHHPASIAYRELRKQFTDKADALHQLRQKMFALESEFLVAQRENQDLEETRIATIADLIRDLGEAEIDHDQQEEHIMALEQYIKRTLPKRTVRPKKAENQGELFAFPSVTKPTIGKNRKKRAVASL